MKKAGRALSFGLAVVIMGFVFSGGILASSLRVEQLGDSWLLPDVYSDSLTNPARLSFLDKNILVAGFSHSLDKVNFPAFNNTTNMFENPSISYAGNFGGIYAGIIFDSFYGGNWTDAAQTSGALVQNASLMAAAKFTSSISAGLRADFTAQYGIIPSQKPGYGGSILAGVDFAMDNMGFGAALSAQNYFSGTANYNTGLNLLYELKLDAGSLIRASLDTQYGYSDRKAVVDSVPNPFGDEKFGVYSIQNKASVSYSATIDKTSCFIALSNDWTPYGNNTAGEAGALYEDISAMTYRRDNFRIKAGMETKFLADWLTVRVSCEPAAYSYREIYNRQSSYGVVVNETRETESEAAIFDSDSITLGFGIKFGEGMNLDVSYGDSSFGRFSNSLVNSTGFADSFIDTSGSTLKAEYTAAW